jgi:hypothetical protein
MDDLDDEPREPPELKHHDLLLLQGFARSEYTEMPAEYHLKGMKRPLDQSERLALSWLRASMRLLNGKKAFREGFLDEYVEPLELPDSFPASGEDPDWEQADDGKQKRRP